MPQMVVPVNDSDIKRFWGKTQRRESGCLEWMAGKFERGYGAFQIAGKTRKAHRLSWEISHGPIPSGMFVCHKCDNPACVDPEHLFLGTAKDNNQDMVNKGRARYPGPKRPPKGIKHHKSILTEQSVMRIRILGRAIKQEEMAAWFGVSKQTISAVLRREIWRGIEPCPQ